MAPGVRHPTSERLVPGIVIGGRHRRPVVLAAVAGVYLLACVLTIGIPGHPLRPLFEGVGPAPPYRWVSPPKQFEATNVQPIAVTQIIPVGATGSPATGVATPEGQLVLGLAAGTFLPSSGRDVLMQLAPKDPRHLGAVPPGLFADGNAYLVTAIYHPGSSVITAAAKTVDAVIETPAPARTVLLSVDGRTWTPIPTHHIPGRAAVATTFVRFGYLLAAADVPVNPRASSSSGSDTVLLPVLLGFAALVAVTAAILWRRRGGTPASPG